MTPPPIIIISEPDPMIGNALRVEFSRLEAVVLLAAGCEEAYALATQTVASLVVLDAATALFEAYETCLRIRRHAGYEACPIVLTAWGVSVRMQAAAAKAGATAMLPKPY